MPGRRAKYRGKNRKRPVQVYLTDRGLSALERGCQKSGLSRPDFIEDLLLEREEDQRKPLEE
jgi:hypothetical protein